MKRVLLLAVVSLIATSTLTFGQDTLPGGLGDEIRDPKKLNAVIHSRDPKYVVVDIRNEYEYERGHIPTAICIPYGRTSSIRNPPEKDKYIIVYCNTGMRSGVAAEQMLADGYKYVLDWGGIEGDFFSGEGGWPYELEKSEKQPVKPGTPPVSEEGC